MQPLGGNEGGRVNSIAVDPRDPNVIWIGTADAGVWRTRDGGANWTLVPVKQLVFEALAAGESVRGAARFAKCSRKYVQQLRKDAQLGSVSSRAR